MSNFLYYRKLDILNRIYVLNYFDFNFLDTASILEVPEGVEVLYDFKSCEPYFDLSNKKLIIAALSQNKIDFVFLNVLLSLALLDNAIPLDGKILAKLGQYFSLREIDLFFSGNEKRDTGAIGELLNKYEVEDLLYHLQYIYFEPLVKKLPQIEKRFMNQSPISTILDVLIGYDIEKLTDEEINKKLPVLSTIIKSFS